MGRRRRRRRTGATRHPGVTVLRPTAGRPYFRLAWADDDGTPRRRSTKLATETEARKQAIALSKRLAGVGSEGVDLGWSAFCQRYEEEHVSGGAPKSMDSWLTACRWYTNLMSPQFLDDVTASTVSRFTGLLRRELEARHGEARATTIAAYLRQLRAALNWAWDVGLLAEKIRIRIPRRARGSSKLARSRPINREEFERIVMQARKIRPRDYPQWERFLWGLWELGFRRGEVVDLSWDSSQPISIDLTHSVPCVRITAGGEKAHTDRTQVITPEFWALVCDDDRTGRVLPLVDSRGRQYNADWIGRIIGRMGRRAGVRTGFGSDKCATTHDIGKRAFTVRLSEKFKLSQHEVAEVQRHDSAQTTRDYYHYQSLDELARKVGWEPGGTDDRNSGAEGAT